MADVSDVQDALVALIASTLYPAGTSLPSVVPVQGIRVYAGWPEPEQIDADLAAQTDSEPDAICHVTVWPLPTERNTTRYLPQSAVVQIDPPTLTLDAAFPTVTVGGTVSTPQNLAIFVNGAPYLYAVQPTDTLVSIATSLATLIAVDAPGTSSAGAVITLPVGARLGDCRVGTQGTVSREIGRQEKVFQVSIWADTPAHRTALSKVIDPVLKALTFLNLPDGTAGRIRSQGSREIDAGEKQDIYRRDLLYTVEYATTLVTKAPQIIAIGVEVDDPGRVLATIYE